MKYLRSTPLLFLWLSIIFNTVHAEILVTDSFESRDFSASSATTNIINFQWGGVNKTGIITQESDSGRRVYPTNRDEYFNDGQDWSAKDGDHSLSLEYPADAHMSEQRFSFSEQNELWIRYWTRVPTNFYHGSSNNKFFALWENDYGNRALNLRWQTHSSGGGSAVLDVQDGGGTVAVERTPFITVPDDQGRWMQIVIHVKAATSGSAGDGIVQLYRRWENEPDFTILHDIQNSINQWNGDGAGWAYGYFMGWANAAYTTNTWWLIDNVEFSSTSLLDIEDESTNFALPPSNFTGNANSSIIN